MKKCLCILLTVGSLAHADGDKAAAQALFDEGRKLMAAGNYTEACPKLEASNQLDPGLGTMLNIADCYEKKGQLAKAWGEWSEIADEAKRAGDTKRESIARGRATNLEPKLPRLTVTFAGGKQPPDGLVVKRDGEVVIAAMFGTPVPVDPGTHTIAAEAPGFQPWNGSIDVQASQSKSFEVPALAPAPKPVVVPPPDHPIVNPPNPDHPIVTPPVAEPTHHGLSGQRKVAIAVGTVGAVGLVAGSIFGVGAIVKWSDVKTLCGAQMASAGKCGANLMPAQDDEKQAARDATIADVGFVVGVAGVATATILWLTDHGSSSERHTSIVPVIAPDGGGVAVLGRF